MALAPEFLDSSIKYQNLGWLQEWKNYWIRHKDTHGNGCSDIDLAGFLIDESRVACFREFLRDYREWLDHFGDAISAGVMNSKLDIAHIRYDGPCSVKELTEFVSRIEAVLDGRIEYPQVHRRGE